MRKSNYQESMSKIKASDKFKTDTIKKMQEELEKQNGKYEYNTEILNKKNNTKYKGFLGAAACFALIIILVVADNKNINIPAVNEVIKDNKSNENILSELPKLKVYNTPSGEMGFEGYLAYDIDELSNSNPWVTSKNISTMPVFKNMHYVNYKSGSPIPEGYLNSEEMIKKAEEIAVLLNIEVSEVYTSPTQEDIDSYKDKTGEDLNQKPYEAVAKGDGVEVSVMSTGEITIKFIEGIELDSKYNFTHTDTSKEEAEKILDYLIDEYSQFIDMNNPAKDLFGDYNIYNKQSFRYNVYDNSGSIIDKILNYNFNTVNFAPNDKGKLGYINILNTNITEKVGDYPIINEDEARTLLIEGKCTSTVSAEFPGEEYIKKVELIYRKSPTEENLMPYYRFYVELPDVKMDNELKTFGAFYVPAVKAEYITYESNKSSKITIEEFERRESGNKN